MDQDLETTEVSHELGTKHQLAVVVIGALVGYAASYLTGAAYGATVRKVREIRANKES